MNWPTKVADVEKAVGAGEWMDLRKQDSHRFVISELITVFPWFDVLKLPDSQLPPLAHTHGKSNASC